MLHFRDSVKEIFLYLKQYKSRTAMTMFGLIWGTMTIALLLSVGEGTGRALKKAMHGMGESIAIMWPGRTSIPFEGYGRGRNLRFRVDDVELLREQIGEYSAISGEFIKYNVPARYKKNMNRVAVSGILPEYGDMRNIIPQPGGRWLNKLDLHDRKRVTFIGNKVAELLFGTDADVIGKYIYVEQTPFLVIGVLKEKIQNSSYSSRDSDRIFIPQTTFQAMYGWRYLNNVVYQLKDPQKAEAVKKQTYQVLGKKYKFDPNDDNALGIWDTTENDKFIGYFILGFNLFLGIIGSITLVVGGIGLANIMYVVVQERTREIGIKRSIGAKRRNILGQFVLEAFVIIGVGALLGLLLAVLVLAGLSALPLDDFIGNPTLSVITTLIAMAVLCLIGFFAGFFPARKASRLQVVDCLRY